MMDRYRWFISIIAALHLSAGCAAAKPPTTAPVINVISADCDLCALPTAADQKTPATTQALSADALFGTGPENIFAMADTTDAPKLSADSSINDLLDALDAVGQGLKDFTAKVALTDNDVATDLTTKRTGQVWYETNADNAKVRVTFDHKIAGRKITDERLDYLLADGKLTDRNGRNKVETKRQVLKPGQKVDLLKLGEGPFPLPIGQKRDDVLANFTVTKLPPDPADPKNTVHLQLTPKPKSSFERKFKSIDVWVDLATHMPARIATLDKAETTTRTTDLSEIKLNGGVRDSDFDLPKLDSDWQSNEEQFTE